MTTDKKVYIFDDSILLANYLVKKWCFIAQEAIDDHNRFMVALPGGQSPLQFFNQLIAEENFDDWAKTHMFLTDERFVPMDDPHSNFGLLRRNLFNYVPVPEYNVHPFFTECGNLELAAEQYKNVLMNVFGQQSSMPRFDFMLLGVGDDGHIASLFPHAEGINIRQRLTIPVSENFLKQERISLSLPVINNSANIFMMLTGSRKAAIARSILEVQESLPANKIQALDGRVTFLLDRESAQQLSNPQQYDQIDEDLSVLNV